MRRRHFIGVSAMVALFALGGAVAWTQTGEPTVATQTFTHEDVVTYTIPTETVVSTQTETVVSTETVTVTVTEPPTTTEPPPPPEGTVLTLVDTRFVCTGPLAALGELPIILEQTLVNTSAAAQHVQGAIDLRSGCAGDGDPATTDLVIHQYGNGREIGPGWDALVMRLGSHDLNVTGFLNCGYLAPGAHQDGLDIRGGLNTTFADLDIGDWDAQFPTCHGAGGLLYLSGFQNNGPLGDRSSDYVNNVLCVRCRMVASKGFYDSEANEWGRAGFIVESVNSGAVDSCFAGHLPFQIRPDDGTRTWGAINPVDVRNVKIDTDSTAPQPSPDECQA